MVHCCEQIGDVHELMGSFICGWTLMILRYWWGEQLGLHGWHLQTVMISCYQIDRYGERQMKMILKQRCDHYLTWDHARCSFSKVDSCHSQSVREKKFKKFCYIVNMRWTDSWCLKGNLVTFFSFKRNIQWDNLIRYESPLASGEKVWHGQYLGDQ